MTMTQNSSRFTALSNAFRRRSILARLRLQAFIFSLSLSLLCRPALAQVPADLMGDIGGYIKQAGTLLIALLTIGVFLAAAYMIIQGAWGIYKERDGGLMQFATGVIVAIIMVLLVTYFVGQGETALNEIVGTSTGG